MDSLRPTTTTAAAGTELVSTVKRLALVFALLVTIALPGGYFGLSYSNLIQHVETVVETKAGAVNALASANPDMWMFQLQRMEDLLQRYPVSLAGERASVRDAAGNVLLTVGAVPDAPVLVRSSALYDSGRVLGQVEIVHSYRTVVLGTLFAGLLGMLLGVMVYFTLLVLPLRALLRTTAALVRETTALRASESKLQSVLGATADGILAVDGKGKVIHTNRRFAELWRIPQALLDGKDDRKLLQFVLGQLNDPETFLKKVRELYHSHANDLETLTFKDGRVFERYSSALLLDGSIDGRVWSFRDITERKQAEAALRAGEEQFRSLVEQSIAGIYILQDAKLAYVNSRFAQIFGYASAEELIGRSPLSLVARVDRAVTVKNLRRWIEGGAQNFDYSFAGRRADGTTIEVGAHGAAAIYRGRSAVIGLIQDISEKARAEEKIQRYIERLKSAFMSTVEVTTALSEMRDPYTAGHERRVGTIAAAIGAELGFDQERIEGLRVAGFMHDIGKITIPSEILSKPGKLSAIEYKLIQGHAQAGYEVLKDVGFPWPVAQVALQHHERMNGSGYPQGLKREAILMEARIIAVADVVEAMASHRPYREAIGIDQALAEIERGRATVYDPVVADACLKLFREKGYAIPQ